MTVIIRIVLCSYFIVIVIITVVIIVVCIVIEISRTHSQVIYSFLLFFGVTPFIVIFKVLVAALGGSWAVINGLISRVTIHIRGLISPLITTHEPPSTALNPKP